MRHLSTVLAVSTLAGKKLAVAEKLQLAESLAEAADNLIFAVRYGEPPPSESQVLELMHSLNDKLIAYRNHHDLPSYGVKPEAVDNPFSVAKSEVMREAAEKAGIPCVKLKSGEPLTDDEILGL